MPRRPDHELEHKLKRNPDDQDAKADVGSDESMDASDPSSATQPDRETNPSRRPVFPNRIRNVSAGVTKPHRQLQ